MMVQHGVHNTTCNDTTVYHDAQSIVSRDLGTTQAHPTLTNHNNTNLIDIDCSEQAQLCVFSKLLHLINPKLNLLNRGWWGRDGFGWSP